MKYVNKSSLKRGKFKLDSGKPYIKRRKFYLGSGKKQRGSFLLLVGLAAKLLLIASTALSIRKKKKKMKIKISKCLLVVIL